MPINDPTVGYAPDPYLTLLNSDTPNDITPGAAGSRARIASRVNARAATGAFANEARQRQQALLDELQGIASGRQKSPAELELEKQVQAASAAGTSNLLGVRDIGGGDLRRQIQTEQSNVQRQGFDDQNVLHSQAQQQAQQALAQFYAQQRGQDLSQADLNAQGTLGQRNVNDQQTMGLLSGGVQAAIQNTNTAQAGANAQMGFGLQQQGINQGWWNMGTQGAASMFDYLGQGGGNSGGSGSSRWDGKLTSLYGDK